MSAQMGYVHVRLCVPVCVLKETLRPVVNQGEAHAEIVELWEVSQFAITIGTAWLKFLLATLVVSITRALLKGSHFA